MGGGDLNLKKSWHPSTMKNMEKVWKAEQQDNEEKKRIAELQKEIAMEKDREEMQSLTMERKDDKKLDWMYKPHNTVDREQYLLGRSVDKQFEDMNQAEKAAEHNRPIKNHVEHECIPPSIRNFQGDEQVDLARKLQEDPLYTIKKKETESRTQLLKNPVKLKQLRQLLEQEKRELKHDKNLKKRKSSEDMDLDHLLAAKYKKLKDKISEEDLIKSIKKHKKHKKLKKKKKKDSSDDSDSSSESDEPKKHSSKKLDRKIRNRDSSSGSDEPKRRVSKKSDNRNRNRDSSCESDKPKKYTSKKHGKKCNRDASSESDEPKKYKSKNHSKKDYESNLRYKPHESKKYKSKQYDKNNISDSSSESGDSRKHKSKKHARRDDKTERRSDEFISQHMHGFGLMRPDGTKILLNKRSSPSRDFKSETKDVKKDQKWIPPKRKKLSEEEKERLRQEMLSNASERDKERERNVKKYEEQERREALKEKSFDKSFLQKHLAKAANQETVASRIKSNINNIQRSGFSMDRNFARR